MRNRAKTLRRKITTLLTIMTMFPFVFVMFMAPYMDTDDMFTKMLAFTVVIVVPIFVELFLAEIFSELMRKLSRVYFDKLEKTGKEYLKKTLSTAAGKTIKSYISSKMAEKNSVVYDINSLFDTRK